MYKRQDPVIYHYSKKAIETVSGILSEQEKNNLIEHYLSYENLIDSRYDAKYCRMYEYLNALLLNEKDKDLVDNARVTDEEIDVTLPGKEINSTGALHPITQMCYDLNDAFLSLGFEVYSENDISSEKFAFDNLNFPKDHPARQSMDTYWIEGTEDKTAEERLCLRPHLTGGSVRYLLEHGAPARFVYPGRVYRNETTDARHERAFFQYEALIVDKDLSFASGKVMIETILELSLIHI